MSTVKIKRMTLHYFKGIQNRTIEFGERETVISGPNASGKSTIMDAFFWALWGKNAIGQSDTKFLIKTVDKDGVEIPHVDHEVEITLDVDGEEQTFRRTLVPEYDRKDNLKGNHTDYVWNDVPLKKKEYDEKVAAVISEEVFKLITSPFAFLTLDWQKQREALMKMAGDIDDGEVLAQKEDFRIIAEKLTGKTLDELKREIDAKLKRVTDEMKDIPARIDEVHRSKPAMPDMEGLKAERAELEKQYQDIERKEYDEAEAINEADRQRNELLKRKTDLAWKQTEMLNSAQREERNAIHMQNGTYTEAEANLKRVEQMKKDETKRTLLSKQNIEARIKYESSLITEQEESLKKLREEWTLTKGMQFSADEYLKCPLYGHVCQDGSACSRYDQNQQGAFDKFMQDKEEKLQMITDNGKLLAGGLKEQKDFLESLYQKVQTIDQAFEACMKELDAQIADYQETMEKNPKRPLISSIKGEDLPEWVKLQEQVDDLQHRLDGMESVQVVRVDHMEEKWNIRKRLDEIAREESAQAQIEAAEKRIEELEALLKELGSKKAEWEYLKTLANEYEVARCNLITEKVNERFKIVRWQMFQRQVNGDEVPACIALVDGVRWTDANTAARINAGIDVASVLGVSYEASAPMFIDNAECSGGIYDPGTSQRILLKFVPGTKEMCIA